MESPIVKADFIPKRETEVRLKRKASSQSILFTISALIGLIALSAWGSFLFYRYFLLQDKAETEISLQEKGNEIFKVGGSVINELRTLDAQLKLVDFVLKKHIVIENFLEFLGDKTLTNSVRYSSMELSTSDEGEIKVELSGESANFMSLANQDDVFRSEPYIIDPNFTDYTLNENGTVSFSVEFEIDPALVSFLGSEGGKRKLDDE